MKMVVPKIFASDSGLLLTESLCFFIEGKRKASQISKTVYTRQKGVC